MKGDKGRCARKQCSMQARELKTKNKKEATGEWRPGKKEAASCEARETERDVTGARKGEKRKRSEKAGEWRKSTQNSFSLGTSLPVPPAKQKRTQ